MPIAVQVMRRSRRLISVQVADNALLSAALPLSRMQSAADADYTQPDYADSNGQQEGYAAEYDDYINASSADNAAASSQQQAAAGKPSEKAVQPAEEFKDAALLQQLDDALLELESEQQQRQQQQQQQHGEQGHKAAGLALPGIKHAASQLTV
jgi:hypothetical protein